MSWLKRLFGGAQPPEPEASTKYPHFVYAKIWEPIQPIARGERYEDPLDAALKAAKLGEVSGGGSLMSDTVGVEYAGVDIDVASLDSLPFIKDILDRAGAPKGSALEYEVDGKEVSVPLGTTEGVAIFLDGTTLPESVYAETSTDELADRLEKALSSDRSAEIRGSFQGPEETAIFIYGEDAEKIYALIAPTLHEHRACQNARVVMRFGNPSLGPREVRIPMHSSQSRT